VYALPVSGADPVQLTNSEDSAMFAVSWFPSDDRILYTYDQGGNELNHVLVRESDGSHRDLTPGEELKASFVGWADDGQSFFLATTERNQKLRIPVFNWRHSHGTAAGSHSTSRGRVLIPTYMLSI
jgi:Tol biopolymer transport system component